VSAELFGVGPPADVVGSHHATADTDKNTARRPAAVVQRTVFASPRAAEFLELRALQAQTGPSPPTRSAMLSSKSCSTTRSTPPSLPAAHR